MKKSAWLIASILVLAGGAFAALRMLPAKRGPSGPPDVPNFALLDQNGQRHSLYDYKDAKAVVIIAFGNSCPIVQQYLGRIQELNAKYEPKGVKFLMIDAHTQDDAESIRAEAKDYGLQMPILLDVNQIIARTLGFKRTTDTVILTPEDWKIRYHGAIDDELGYSVNKMKAQNHYLSDALDAVLDGRQAENSAGEVKGCAYSFWKSDGLTYEKNIAPVITAKCASCHSGKDGLAAFSDEAKLRASGAKITGMLYMREIPHKGGSALESEEAYHLFNWLNAPAETAANKQANTH